jgi:putative two-component system response regulator
MERQTTVGHEILDGFEGDLLWMAAAIALTHHERWDGGGHPRGLAGQEIPIEGGPSPSPTSSTPSSATAATGRH